MTSLFKTWDRLSVHGETGSGYVRLRLPEVSGCATYAAKRVGDDLEAILIEVETASIPGKADYPDARGLDVRAETLIAGRSGSTRLILSLSDGRYRDVFHTLAEDIVSKLAEADDEPTAVKLFVSRLTRWQTFLRRHGHRGLSLEERRGLLGELFLLRNYILRNTDTDTAISSWKGCHGANHDFQFLSGSIEVKTTSSNTPHTFHISNIKQLDSPGQGHLFVFFALVEESEAGKASLPGVIDSIRDELDGTALDAFEDCLVEAGYLEIQRELYSSPRYSLRKERFFKVEDTFPRLRETLLPGGVEEVRYQVAIAACAAFEVLPSDVIDTVLGTPEASQ